MHPPSLVRIALLVCLLWLTPSLQAHEFWFKPIASPQARGATANLRLEVGEFFVGEAAGFSIATTQGLRHITPQAQQDLRPFLPADAPEAEVALALEVPGTHLLAYDSTARHITLDAHKFQAYLHDEGLDFIKVLREKAGTDQQPGRERYRRHIKTLVQVGPPSRAGQATDATYATRVGQRLEILPLRNPLTQAPGATLPLRIEFDKKPLVGALVKAWHKHKDQLLTIRATTSAQGQVEFNLPYAGDWMISVVHMIPVTDEDGVDWESLWGNLSFHIPERPAARGAAAFHSTAR
ncbi:MAG: hypothetical protein CFE43_07650 [Burkholderiales bacterium PBB3]|nr:MAG: hypothetical protein CFE43_07650 [Burkholderiales bacterium PBB3]